MNMISKQFWWIDNGLLSFANIWCMPLYVWISWCYASLNWMSVWLLPKPGTLPSLCVLTVLFVTGAKLWPWSERGQEILAKPQDGDAVILSLCHFDNIELWDSKNHLFDFHVWNKIESLGNSCNGNKQAWVDAELLLAEVSVTPFCQT